MGSVIPIVKSGTPAATRELNKLSGRLAAMERLDTAEYRRRVKQVFGNVLNPDAVVARILNDVREKGDAALIAYSARFDRVKLTSKTLRVSDAERRAAYQRTPHAVREALELAAERIAEYQKRLMPADVNAKPHFDGPKGVQCGMKWSPLRRIGAYIPGGTAAYPSSVLMNIVPAQVAGVNEIAVMTPCGADGAVSDGVLCACESLRVSEIYRVGGAQAIGAFAFGTKTIAPADKIVGPGNLFVMLAKRAVFGHVDIDMLAGPSEVLVIADDSANPEYIAADLLAQAEHDGLASCVLLTDSMKLAEAVSKELAAQLSDLPRAPIATAALKNWGLAVVTKSLAEAAKLANQLAPEHLEIMTRSPHALAKEITSAGAIFIGQYATEPLGDYIAGPSHTLPTGATAKAFSGLSVFTFLRRTSIIEAKRRASSATGLSFLRAANMA